jgi:DNA-binding transcriptional regulator YiaG
MCKEFINKIIELSGLTTRQFAEKIKVSIPTVRKWRKGESDPLFHNQKIIRSVFKNEVTQIKKLNMS